MSVFSLSFWISEPLVTEQFSANNKLFLSGQCNNLQPGTKLFILEGIFQKNYKKTFFGWLIFRALPKH